MMQICLPSDAIHFIEGLVASGEYQSADEAVADGVRLLMGRQQLRAEIQKGIDELDAGQGIEGERVFAELRKRSKNLTEQACFFKRTLKRELQRTAAARECD